MTREEFIAARKNMHMTQGALANLLGMSLRAVQDIENGRSDLRDIHVLALERVSLSLAATYGHREWVPSSVLKDIKKLEEEAPV